MNRNEGNTEVINILVVVKKSALFVKTDFFMKVQNGDF